MAPGLSWLAMQIITGVNLQLLTDYDAYLMIETAIGGGLIQCCRRFATAKNTYLEHDYDRTKPTSHLIYLDCINLYGIQMMKALPHGDFTVGDKYDDWLELLEDAPYGYILECDVYVHECVHDALTCHC